MAARLDYACGKYGHQQEEDPGWMHMKIDRKEVGTKNGTMFHC
jgi:hypothetical protein